MNRNKYIVLTLLMTTLLALVAIACYHRTPEQRAERVVQHLVSTLGLNADQTAKLEKIKEECMARRPDMAKMREESLKDIVEMMKSPQIDEAKLKARTEKIQAHANDVISFISAKFAELHDILTPEQRKQACGGDGEACEAGSSLVREGRVSFLYKKLFYSVLFVMTSALMHLGARQRRFWEHRIRDDADLNRHMDYIHFNPVKHGFAVAPRAWRYSSFHRYVEAGRYHPEWGLQDGIRLG